MTFSKQRDVWRKSAFLDVGPKMTDDRYWMVLNRKSEPVGIGHTKEEALFRAFPELRDYDEPLLDFLPGWCRAEGWRLVKLNCVVVDEEF